MAFNNRNTNSGPRPKRVNIGSIVKSKQAGQPDYIKISKGVTLAEGETLSLESAKSLLESADYLEKNNKVSAEIAYKMRERASKIPDFVRFNIVQKTTTEE